MRYPRVWGTAVIGAIVVVSLVACTGSSSPPRDTPTSTSTSTVNVDVDPSPDVWPAAADILNGLIADGVPLADVVTYPADSGPASQVGSTKSLVSQASAVDERIAADVVPAGAHPVQRGVVVAVFDSLAAANYQSRLLFQKLPSKPAPAMFNYGPVVVFVSGYLDASEQTDYSVALSAYIADVAARQ